MDFRVPHITMAKVCVFLSYFSMCEPSLKTPLQCVGLKIVYMCINLRTDVITIIFDGIVIQYLTVFCCF